MIVYSVEFDFRKTSDYFSIINPSHFAYSTGGERVIRTGDQEYVVKLANTQPMGVIDTWIEMECASERKYINDIGFLIDNNYVSTFNHGERKQALDFIRTVVYKNITWDL